LKKPLPWASDPIPGSRAVYTEPTETIETQRYCALVLAAIVLACVIISIVTVSRQNRMTR
jgi:hypothetical protein